MRVVISLPDHPTPVAASTAARAVLSTFTGWASRCEPTIHRQGVDFELEAVYPIPAADVAAARHVLRGVLAVCR